MNRICPYCGSQVPFELARPGAETIFCPGCGQQLDLPKNPQPDPLEGAAPPPPPRVDGTEPPEPTPLDQIYSAPCDSLASLSDQLGQTPVAEPIPWEGEGSIVNRLISTTGEVLFHPSRAFKAPPAPGYKWALTFGLILTTLGITVALLWGYVMEEHELSRTMLMITIVLTPLLAWPLLFILAGLQHLFLLMVGGAKTGYYNTFRVTCYCQATVIFYLIPVIGSWVTLIWQIAATTVGLSEAHHIGRGRAFWAVILPYILAVIIAVVVVAALVGTGFKGMNLPGLINPL